MEHVKFGKIPRLSRECIITEKIDGTNACIYIGEDGEFLTGSRNRWITPEDDNFGFSKWAYENKDSLVEGLGPGTHYGEWWGGKIQRGYGIKERRFSLFNTSRWNPVNAPACCDVVPCLYIGDFNTDAVESALDKLKEEGSYAAPGFFDPEGVVVYHTASRSYFKKTIKNDEKPKGN